MTEPWNAFIGFPDYTRAHPKYATVSFSGGSWVAAGDVALANLKSQVMQDVARSTDCLTTSTQFVVDLGTLRAIGGLYLEWHIISPLGRHRWTVATDSGFTDIALQTA